MYTFISLIARSIWGSLAGNDLILRALTSTLVRFGSFESLLSSSSKFSEESGLPQILILTVSRKSNLRSALETLSRVESSSSVLGERQLLGEVELELLQGVVLFDHGDEGLLFFFLEVVAGHPEPTQRSPGRACLRRIFRTAASRTGAAKRLSGARSPTDTGRTSAALYPASSCRACGCAGSKTRCARS